MHEQQDQRDHKIELIKKWLLDQNKSFAGEIDLDADLIERRIIDSLRFMEFVIFLEELTDREIGSDPKTIASLRTLRKIRDHVL